MAGKTRAAAALVIAAVLAALLAAASPGRAWASGGTAPSPLFAVRPSAEGQTPLPGGHFSYSVPAGAHLADAVVVENLTSTPLTLQLYGADLLALPGGGFGVGQLGSRPTGAAAWIAVEKPSVTLAPRQQQTVGFTVEVPRSTFSGDYAAAVVAQNAPSPQRGVAVQFRVALQVRIHVLGAAPHLAGRLGPLRASKERGGVDYTAVLDNTGNETFQFSGTVAVRVGGAGRLVRLSLSPAGDYLLPGQHVQLHARWTHTPIWGSARAYATVRLVGSVGPAAVVLHDGPAKVSFFPWWLVIMACIALLLLLFAIVEVWRHRRELRQRARAARERRRAVRAFKRQLDQPPGPDPRRERTPTARR